jgi:thiol-disulfide isomerase/thioredoxin
LKKILLTLSFSTLSLLALDIGDKIPQEIQNKLELKDNQLYVLDFFASWCKSCKKELPLIEKVYEANATNIIAINVDKKKEDGEKLVAKLKLTFPVVYDEDKSLVKAFDPIGFPAIYYVKNNQILKVIVGAIDDIDEQIINDVKEMK